MGFQAKEVALEAAARLKGPMDRIRKQKAELGDQIERAAMSMVLNIAEAARRTGRDRRNRWTYASGSANEARAALELAVRWNLVEAAQAQPSLDLLDRVCAMLWRLEHPRSRPQRTPFRRGPGSGNTPVT